MAEVYDVLIENYDLYKSFFIEIIKINPAYSSLHNILVKSNFIAELYKIKKVSFLIKYIAELKSGNLSTFQQFENIEGCEKNCKIMFK